MGHSKLLNEIISEMGGSDFTLTRFIPREKVQYWIGSEDIEILGAVYALIGDKRHYTRIQPALSFKDYHTFIMHYYERCFKENPKSEWANSRYSAGWDLVNWFIGLWNDPDVPRKALKELKDWLAKLYKDGNDDLRTCLVTATLEHLFEKRKIAGFFKDWKEKPILKIAYSQAMGWQTK